MREYVTVNNELVIAKEIEPVNEYCGVIIVEDAKGLRYVVKRKRRLKPRGPKRIDINITKKVRATSPEGVVKTYKTVAECAKDLDTNPGYINRYAKTPAKAGKWLGWKFEKF